ncbi:TetR/AcrR family transcriptional regulator [Paludisphaera rhizosphaerae]|uniref:TetR/AcrR family transcriptional regulator n=1 Tax=Paludisphaera rhizosphaerae TaxID=2711216 RepID=UPI0013EB26BB|nr:TetR/AcrR family transcriptional regulator [Paludisphaera rhizosphaerae]
MAERVDVGAIRRAQIVDAACRVIQQKGIQGASLSEIEHEAGISRGVLTYHFPTKESILLAVFDETMTRIKAVGDADMATAGSGWERLERGLDFMINRKPANDEVDALNYTFLAQISHREDFRARLAAEYVDIRKMIARDLSERAREAGLAAGEVEALAAIIHGVLSGLNMQLNVDPQALERAEVVRTLKVMLEARLGGGVKRSRAAKQRRT